MFSIIRCSIFIRNIIVTAAFISNPQSHNSHNGLSFKCKRTTPFILSSSVLGQETDTASIVDVPVKVDRVNICMGELCKCQEEGNNAESIMADLQSRNLAFVVEDAPCLGACGVGSMVSIEYQDGDYALVTGLEETLSAIGITESGIRSIEEIEEGAEIGIKTKDDAQILNTDKSATSNKSDTVKNLSDQTSIQEHDYGQTEVSKVTDSGQEEKEVEGINIMSKVSVVEKEHDAVKRMRAEYEREESLPNPWMNMALYIGDKVKEKLLKDA